MERAPGPCLALTRSWMPTIVAANSSCRVFSSGAADLRPLGARLELLVAHLTLLDRLSARARDGSSHSRRIGHSDRSAEEVVRAFGADESQW